MLHEGKKREIADFVNMFNRHYNEYKLLYEINEVTNDCVEALNVDIYHQINPSVASGLLALNNSPDTPFVSNSRASRSRLGTKGEGESIYIYSDAAWFAGETSLGGAAFWRGNRILSWPKKECAQSPRHAGAKALLIATKIAVAVDRSWSSVTFHSDARELVNAVNKENDAPWDCFHELEDFRSSCDFLAYWVRSWIRRTANGPPHDLAKLGKPFVNHQLHIF